MIAVGLVGGRSFFVMLNLNKKLYGISKIFNYSYSFIEMRLRGIYILYIYADFYDKIKKKLKTKNFKFITASKILNHTEYLVIYCRHIASSAFLIFSYRRSKDKSNRYLYHVFDLYIFFNLISNTFDVSHTENLKKYSILISEYTLANWIYFVKEIIVDIKNMIKEIYEKSTIIFEYPSVKIRYYGQSEDESKFIDNVADYQDKFLSYTEFISSIQINMYNFYLINVNERRRFSFYTARSRKVSIDVRKLTFIFYEKENYIGVNLLISKKRKMPVLKGDIVKIYYLKQYDVRLGTKKDFLLYLYCILITDYQGYNILKSKHDFMRISYENYVQTNIDNYGKEANPSSYIVVVPAFDKNQELYNFLVYKRNNFYLLIFRTYILSYTDENKMNFRSSKYIDIVFADTDNSRIFQLNEILLGYKSYKNIINNKKLDGFMVDFLFVENVWILFLIYILKNSVYNTKYYISCEENNCDGVIRYIEKIYTEVLPPHYGKIKIDVSSSNYYWLVAADKVSNKAIIILLRINDDDVIDEITALIGKEQDIIAIMNKIKLERTACISYREHNLIEWNTLDRYKKNIISTTNYASISNIKIDIVIYASVKLC